MSKINCPDCGKDIEPIDWAAHKTNHPIPVQSSMPFKPTKKLMKAANDLFNVMAKSGGGSIGIYEGGVKKEIINIPPAV